MKIRIRNFSTSQFVHSISELKSALIDDFVGDSVALEFIKPTGIYTSVFIDVSLKDGVLVVKDSYKQDSVINIDDLFSA